MFNLSEIKELIQLVDQSSLQELEIKHDGYKLAIRKPKPVEAQVVAPALSKSFVPEAAPIQATPAPVADKPAESKPSQRNADENLHAIVSPMVGTFYQAPAPDAPPFVKVGDKVHEKTVVCIIEAMKLMNEIEAEVNGEIVEVLVENGQLVEYGQPLFLVRV